MEKALQDYLSSAASIRGSIVTDGNGLLISAHGTLKDCGNSAGRVTAISRQAQILLPNGGNSVNVIIQMSNDDQIIVKRVGNLTVAINESNQ